MLERKLTSVTGSSRGIHETSAMATEEQPKITLSQLAKLNEPEQMQRLIDDGADPSASNRIGQTALHVACIWGNCKCVEVLIKAGAQVLRARHHTICPATRLSMLRQRMRGCQYAGYVRQVNAQNHVTGGTPLHSAAQESERGERKGDRGDKDGRIVCIKMLLEAGASLNIAVRIPPVRVFVYKSCILECILYRMCSLFRFAEAAPEKRWQDSTKGERGRASEQEEEDRRIR